MSPQALIFLYDFGFPFMGHVQSGNIFVDGNICQLGGYENMLLGYRSRQYREVAKEGHVDSIDVIMFGEWVGVAVGVAMVRVPLRSCDL